MRNGWSWSAVVLCASFAGCSFFYTSPGGNDGGVPPGVGVGGACGSEACRAGLVCTGGRCAPGHASTEGTPCTISDECASGLYCGPARTCAQAGTGGDGAGCSSDADCAAGLRCNLVGFGTACQPEGTADVGGACGKSGDCFGGLACANGQCAPLPQSPGGGPPLGIPSYAGETCGDDPGPSRAYFRVPRGAGDGDFYRLPFPNDIRTRGGHPDLSGHPSPGASLLGFDPVDRYLRDVERTVSGFSPSSSVILRFSAAPDFETLKAAGAVKLVDITPGGEGNERGYYWQAATGRNKYLCANHLVLRPPRGVPLDAGHTYAVIIGATVKDSRGALFARDADFQAVLAAQAPAEAALMTAWTAYKPLRDWAAKKAVDPASILTAAVFTVGHPATVASRLPAAVAAAPAPAASGWVRCGDAPSPCPQAMGDRACGAADPAFDELHALVSLPIFQQGAAPYFDPSEGGDLDLGGDGTPRLVRTEQVCMALTVPRGIGMPQGGWPLVIYAHGTGGSFRSGVPDLGARLANLDDGSGGRVHVAVLGIDQVEHGTRRGSSMRSPNDLFYNFANPAAARGNPLQGAADQLSLLRLASSLRLAGDQSPTRNEIRFGAIAFWGHSQGATEVSTAVPYATGVAGVVLSGQGASLMDSLLAKKSPVNVAAALPIVLQDAVDVYHPVLSILQTDLDLADPLNHALAMAASPPVPGAARHVFQPYGQDDTYSPPTTELTYALAARLAVAQPPRSVASPTQDLTDRGLRPVPVAGNLDDNGRAITAVVREYAPRGYDGHFVAFQDADARKDVDHFLADVLSGVAPPRVGR